MLGIFWDPQHFGKGLHVVMLMLAVAETPSRAHREWRSTGALIGARAFYVANHFASYESPVEWFKLWEGGISLLGGITGALLAAAPVVRRRRLGFLPLMDLAAPWLALGIAVGRIGDLLIADHLGATTTSPLGFRCPEIVDVGRTVGSRCPPGQLVHLTAAYDLLAALAICGALLFFQRRPRRHGQATFLLGLLYGLGRLGLDFLRQDIRRFGLTGSQWTALGLVAITLALLTRHRRQTDDPGDRAEGAPLTPSTSTVDEGDR